MFMDAIVGLYHTHYRLKHTPQSDIQTGEYSTRAAAFSVVHHSEISVRQFNCIVVLGIIYYELMSYFEEPR